MPPGAVSPGAALSRRGVGAHGGPNTGFPVSASVSYNGQGGWFQVGGTSAGAPEGAAIIAAADQLRVAGGGSVLTSAGV